VLGQLGQLHTLSVEGAELIEVNSDSLRGQTQLRELPLTVAEVISNTDKAPEPGNGVGCTLSALLRQLQHRHTLHVKSDARLDHHNLTRLRNV
jgi:hypothetical protein